MLTDDDGPLGLPVGLVALALTATGAALLAVTPFQFASVPTQLASGLLAGGLLTLAGVLALSDDRAEIRRHFLGDRD